MDLLARVQLLVVVADEGERRAVQRSLEDAEMSATLTEVSDGPTALQVLAERTFDAVLLDEGTFGGACLQILSAVRERGVHVPFIVLTTGSEVGAVDLMKQGAADCVPKTHLDSDRLAQSLRQAIRVTRAEQGTRDAEAALAHRAGRFARLALASPRIHASLSVEETIATVAQEARELFGVSFAVTRVTVDGQTLVRVAAAPELVSAARAQRRAPPKVTELAAKMPQPSGVRRIDRSQVVEAPVLGELHQALIDEGYLVDEWLVAPMASRDQTILGSVHLAVPPGGFDDADVRLFEELMHTASIALENAGNYRTARDATRARDDVLAIVSHDLRNPLNNVELSATLLSEMLAERGGTEPETQLVERVHRAVARMNRLIADLLEASLVESGKLTLTRSTQRAASLVGEALDANSALAEAKGVSLRRGEGDGEVLEVCVDRFRTLQALGNVIGNAIKFTEVGGAIEVTVEKVDDRAVIAVRDDGPGIDPHSAPHLFERFWKGPDATREGAGLGLFIARGIVEAQGGSIAVESELGHGTTVRITLPLVESLESR